MVRPGGVEPPSPLYKNGVIEPIYEGRIGIYQFSLTTNPLCSDLSE